jgi:hypothetical protein
MAETTLPEPLVPAEVDLTDFKFMPLEVARLLDSEIMALEDAEAFRAGVASWCKGWHQIPAASLPNDDCALCKTLGYGRDLKTWAKLRRAGALRGWILCADGRLYHPIVAEKALEAWLEKLAQRLSSGAGNAKRWGIEFDATQINEQVATARRFLTALNPQSKALTKRKPPAIPTGNQSAVPHDIPAELPNEVPQDDGRQSRQDSRQDGGQDSRQDRKRQRQGQRQGDLSLASGDKSPSAAAKAREDALCQPAGISDGDLADSVETVFSAVARSAENWFDAVERDRHDGDEVVIRGWLELAGSAGLSDADAVQAIAEAIDRQFERLSKRPRVGMPVSLELIDKDVRAAISAARRNPSKVADEARAPEPYAARFTATQWTTWLKPCAVTVADGIATITAPTMVIADRLRVHHDQDLRVCLDVDAVEVVSAPRRKGASATIIPHPATVAEASK